MAPPTKRPKLTGGAGSPTRPRGPSGAPSAPSSANEELKRKIAAKLNSERAKAATSEEPSLIKWEPPVWKAWSECPNVSPIQGTEFIVIKAPLSTVYEPEVLAARGAKGASAVSTTASEKDDSPPIFTLDSFMEDLNAKSEVCQVLIDAIPDQAKALYTREVMFDDWDLEHVKFPIEPDQAKGLTAAIHRFVPPSRAQVASFISVANRVWDEDPDAKIAVTSTFGYNRAGTFIVSYLVEMRKVPLAKAMETFAKSRPPGVYSKSCVLALQRRYAPKLPLALVAAPPWDPVAVACGAAKDAVSQLPPQGGAPPANPTSVGGRSAANGPSSATKAPGGSMPPPPGKPNPPAPWKAAWSSRENRYYFFNPATKKSVWKIEDCK